MTSTHLCKQKMEIIIIIIIISSGLSPNIPHSYRFIGRPSSPLTWINLKADPHHPKYIDSYFHWTYDWSNYVNQHKKAGKIQTNNSQNEHKPLSLANDMTRSKRYTVHRSAARLNRGVQQTFSDYNRLYNRVA